MKKTILIASLLGMAIIPAADATTVGFAFAFSGRRVAVTSAATQLGTTSLVMLGAFADPTKVLFNSAQTIQANFTRISSEAGWTEFPSVNGTDNYAIGANGTLNGTGTDTSSAATALNGKQIYIWLFDAATTIAATQMGVYTALSDANWLFPANGTAGDSTNLGTTAGTNITPVNSIGNVTTSQIQLVPEPSTALLTAAGLLAMASRRRRRNRN